MMFDYPPSNLSPKQRSDLSDAVFEALSDAVHRALMRAASKLTERMMVVAKRLPDGVWKAAGHDPSVVVLCLLRLMHRELARLTIATPDPKAYGGTDQTIDGVEP